MKSSGKLVCVIEVPISTSLDISIHAMTFQRLARRATRLILVASLVAFGIGSVSSPVSADEDDQTGTIVANITALQNRKGSVKCALHTADNWLESSKAVQKTSVPLSDDKEGATCRFEDLGPGTYAVGVFHDENDNGEPDPNMFGIPTEALGVSNNNLPAMSAPKFKDAKFQLDGGTKTLTIKLEY